MRYVIKESDYKDSIFNLSPGSFLKKYKKQIVESNLDKNIKNYIIDSLEDYDDNLYIKEFDALELFLTLFLQFVLHKNDFNRSFAYHILSIFDTFNIIKDRKFKAKLKKKLDKYKEVAKFNIYHIYNSADEELMDKALEDITYELLSDNSLYNRGCIIGILDSYIENEDDFIY